MKKIITLITNFLMISFFAQVGINTDKPEAVLDIYSITDGVLLPRLTVEQINSINKPKEGLLLYNLTDNCLQVYDGYKWDCLGVIKSKDKKTDKLYVNSKKEEK